jgi:outer membrane protease
MGKKIFIFVFSAVLIFNLSAKEHDFSVGASFGLLSGQAQEIVYRDYKSEDKLSELLWNFKALPYIGLDINYSWLKPGNNWGLFVKGSIKHGFSGGKDVMEDRDWLVLNYPNWLTHYSVHNNNTESANLMDYNLGASFLISKGFLLKAYFSYHYMYYSWAASGGSLLYPDWDLNGDGNPDGDHIYLPMYISSKEKVCTYEQTWHILSPGISFYGEFNRYFDIEVAFELTPFIWCNAKDQHLLRGLVVTDTLKNGIFIEPSFLFSYKPSNFFAVSLSFEYRDIKKSRGDTKYQPTGEPSFTEKKLSGAGFKAFDIGIIAKYKL